MLIPFTENTFNSKDFQMLIGRPKEEIIEEILMQFANGIKDSVTGNINILDFPYLAASAEILRNWLLSQCNNEQKETYNELKSSEVNLIGIDSSQMPLPKLPKNLNYELLSILFQKNQHQIYIDDNGVEWEIQKGRRNGENMYYLYTEREITDEMIQAISKEYTENGKTREVIEYDILEDDNSNIEEYEFDEDDFLYDEEGETLDNSDSD